MGKMDQGFKDLLAEVAQLVDEAVRERMESEEFQRNFGKIIRRMSDNYDCVIGGIALTFGFMIIPTGEGRGRKPDLSFNFKFGGSGEDKAMGEFLGLGERDFDEMNRVLEQARQERSGGKGKNSIAPADAEVTPQSLAETEEAAESADPRSVSQIINSIRAIARALNLNQRRFLAKSLEMMIQTLTLGQRVVAITEEQIKDDTAWLRGIQNLINRMQNCGGSKSVPKESFLALEEIVKRAAAL